MSPGPKGLGTITLEPLNIHALLPALMDWS
jgi:hypothetical protein